MKKTLFIATLLACCTPWAQSATYTDLTTSWCDEENHVIYDGKGYFAVESGSTTSVDLTISLDSLVSYVNSNDYKTGGYMLLWDMNVADYGMADNADMSKDTGSRTPFISGYANDAAWNTTTNNISYETLYQYAPNGSLTLTITSHSSKGVTVSTTDSAGKTVSLYTADGLKVSTNNVTNGYYVNLNYVTAVTLNTASTLNTDTYVPPVDYSAPFVSSRTDDTTIGRVTFLGDSITHGVNDQSYRWQLFKTLTDNGIENQIAGPREGYDSTPNHTEDAGSSYGGAAFANVHLAQASGRTHNIISGSNSGMTGVNYGGHSTASTGEKYDSNTWICMMGTNDLLSDGGSSTTDYCNKMAKMLGGSVEYTEGKYVWTADANNTGTMGTIVDDVYGEGDTFYMLSITPWGDHANSNAESFHYGAQEFNRNLKEWVSTYAANTGKNVVYVDVTRGMVDLTSTISFDSHNAFWNTPGSDGLHPNDQGSIIMAGNLARGMGIGGRTAGLARADKSTADTAWHSATVGTDGTVGRAATYRLAENAFTQDGGYTVDFRAAFGNGATDGWLGTDNTLSISIGDGANSGTLNLSEGYIMWGTDVLFCADTSALDENLRIAWHNGNSTDNVLGGYYVWLGDMLIGQGLAADATSSGLNGIAFTATGASGSITDLSWSNTAYAPTTTLTTSTEYAYHTQQDAGTAEVIQNTYLWHNNTESITTSGVNYGNTTPTTITASSTFVTSAQSASTHIITTANPATSTSAWVGMVNCEYESDIHVQHTGNINATIFGSMNAGNAGKLVLDIEAGSTIGSVGTYNGVKAAIAGSYGGGDAEEFNVYINGGSIGGNIVGGSVNGAGSIGEVNIVVNDGEIIGNIYGGSNADHANSAEIKAEINKASVGQTNITVNGGKIDGSIFAGGNAGTIGDANITINGGIVTGSITKGDATRTTGATTSVTVVGNKTFIAGSIEADTVTLRDVSESGFSNGFDKYANTITTKKMVLDNVQTELVASVSVEELSLTNGTNTSLIMGDIATLESLTLDANTTFGAFKAAGARSAETGSESTLTLTTLTVGKGATLNANIVLGAGSTLRLEDCLTMGSTVSLTSGMTIDLSEELLALMYRYEAIEIFSSVDALTIDGNNIAPDSITQVSFNVDNNLQNFNVGYSNVGTVSITLIPEPATATLSLLALVALAARRRRK